MTDALLQLNGVTRRYGTGRRVVTALFDAHLAVFPGDVVGVFGPSGSGKTTLLHLAAGWDTPDEGVVRRPGDGPDAAAWPVAVAPQGIGLVAELTARDNVAIVGARAGHDRADVDAALREVGVDPDELGDRVPAELSLGQQQRVAIARALVVQPRVLIADEPTAHQDEANADRVFDALVDHAARGAAVLVSTHDARLLPRFDRTVTLTDGRVTEPG